MAIETGIGWCDSTVNFWHGCKKVSPGCKYCYMMRDKKRYKQDPTLVQRAKPGTFNQALNWKVPKRIFTCSWSDFFIAEADEWRADAWDIIRRTPQHTWLILTKRIDRVMECLPPDWGDNGYPNVWIGVSVEDQKHYSRVAKLAKVPAVLRFVSFEPLLGAINIPDVNFYRKHIQWSILGGESGNDVGEWRYRPSELHWYSNIISQLNTLDHISVQDPYQWGHYIFVKQLGTHLAKLHGLKDRAGADMSEWPVDVQRLQQIPSIYPPVLGTILREVEHLGGDAYTVKHEFVYAHPDVIQQMNKRLHPSLPDAPTE